MAARDNDNPTGGHGPVRSSGFGEASRPAPSFGERLDPRVRAVRSVPGDRSAQDGSPPRIVLRPRTPRSPAPTPPPPAPLVHPVAPSRIRRAVARAQTDTEALAALRDDHAAAAAAQDVEDEDGWDGDASTAAEELAAYEARSADAARAFRRHRAMNLGDEAADPASAWADGEITSLAGPQEATQSLSPEPHLRYRQLLTLHPGAAKDFVLGQVEILLARGTPRDMIANVFRVSISHVYGWERAVEKRQSTIFKKLQTEDVARVIGRDISQFELRIQLGMQMATKANATPAQVSAGLRAAELAQTNLINYREKLGYYDKRLLSPVVQDETDHHTSDARLLTDGVHAIMGEVFDALSIMDDEENGAPVFPGAPQEQLA